MREVGQRGRDGGNRRAGSSGPAPLFARTPRSPPRDVDGFPSSPGGPRYPPVRGVSCGAVASVTPVASSAGARRVGPGQGGAQDEDEDEEWSSRRRVGVHHRSHDAPRPRFRGHDREQRAERQSDAGEAFRQAAAEELGADHPALLTGQSGGGKATVFVARSLPCVKVLRTMQRLP